MKKAAIALLLATPILAATAPWTAPDEAQDRKSPLKPDEATFKAAAKLYADRCANCHGIQGKGDGRASAYMPVKPRDLTAEDTQVQTDGALHWKISTGRRPMPNFDDKLSNDERWQLVAYLRRLGELHGASAAPAEKK